MLQLSSALPHKTHLNVLANFLYFWNNKTFHSETVWRLCRVQKQFYNKHVKFALFRWMQFLCGRCLKTKRRLLCDVIKIVFCCSTSQFQMAQDFCFQLCYCSKTRNKKTFNSFMIRTLLFETYFYFLFWKITQFF